MLSTLIIVFREVLEAMLVVGIATAAAREAHIANRWIYGGIAGGLVAAVIVALFADMLSASMQGMGQEVLNAAILIAASLMMSWTAIWMGKHGREMSQKIRQTCRDVEGSGTAKLVLSMVVGLAVAREGSEVVLFLYGVAASGDAGTSGMLSGGATGMLLGIVVALGLYQSLIHVPLRYVFLVVTCLIVLLSAGMASQGVAWLVTIDMLPAWGQPIWNSPGMISAHSVIGQLLHALMGYDDRPSGMQVFTFATVLSLTWLAIRQQKKPAVRPAGAVAAVMLVCAMISIQATNAQAKQVYSPIVEQGEQEVGARAVNNTGIGYALRSKWRWKRYMEPAIELYGSLGEVGNTNSLSLQSHQIGPVLLGKLRSGLTYEAGYLFGLTTASDQGHLKFILGYEF